MDRLSKIYSKALGVAVYVVRALAVIAGLILPLILWCVLKICFTLDEIQARKR